MFEHKGQKIRSRADGILFILLSIQEVKLGYGRSGITTMVNVQTARYTTIMIESTNKEVGRDIAKDKHQKLVQK